MSPVDRVYVGATTHSSPSGITAFDLTTGEHGPQLVARAHVSGIVHPTFLAPHPNGSVLYAVSETVNGEIVALRVHGDDLAIEQRVPSCGDGPCHLSTDGRHLVVANYGSGSAAAYTLTTDGRLDELVWTGVHRGDGPHHRQDGPHAHCAVLDPHRASVHVVDLGIDRVVRYDADHTGFHRASETTVAPGAGPRHLAFHPSERTAFVICELDNTVVVLDTSGADPVVRSTMSTLPDHVPDDVPDDVPKGGARRALEVSLHRSYNSRFVSALHAIDPCR